MWWRSASFILDGQQHQNDGVAPNPESALLSSPSMADSALNPKSNVSAYYQTRAAHHAVITSDWLAQAQAATDDGDSLGSEAQIGGKGEGSGKAFSVIDEFNNWRKQPDLAEAVAAIRALAAAIRKSEATTMMELEIELKKASDSLKSWDATSISLTAGCDLFMRYRSLGKYLARVVLEVMKTAAENKKLFRVLCTKGRPDRTGLRFSNELAKLDVPVKLLIDSAVAYTMDEVDMVFFGADGVVESGGIINMMGTFQIALVAHSMNKPVYVAAESYKFARHYLLNQKDMAPALRPIDFGVPIPSKVEVETSGRDYTPPQYLTLLFTDLGVPTPSVISDELIQLYL
ncbi:protein LURP-one-related 11-like isoform 1 [Hibiscus syriacus]|uniref:Translation initiation factor eIF2B subunit alpha n=1 Tax=Hibiscus syriacus TaxID=106335 RepID=A0A6A2WK47_HIBSY|nr:protein LURP-one-related 11-like isoform 1 [Hibiscus syriacus]